MLVFLIGFMGSGKSYISRHAGPEAGLPYVDMDHAIQDKVGKTITEVFADRGEVAFRQMEAEYLKQLNSSQDVIIATGGGAPCFGDNMELMNHKGITIFIDRPAAEIIDRLVKGKHKRPLLADKNDVEIRAFFHEKMKERLPYYSLAYFNIKGETVQQIAMIIKALQL